MNRLEAMEIIVKIADEGSLSSASKELNMSTATLSRRLSEYESYLGTKLLTRNTRKLAFTDVGKKFLESAREILASADAAEKCASQAFSEEKGELTVTAPLAYGTLHLVSLISEFTGQYPDISISLKLSDFNADLIADNIDLAVRIGKQADSQLIAIGVGTTRISTCASEEYIKANPPINVPEDLCKHKSFICFDNPMTREWHYLYKSSKKRIDIKIKPNIVLNTAEAALTAAANGSGIVRTLHYQAHEFLKNNRLTEVLTDYAPLDAPIQLVHASQKIMPRRLRLFIDFIIPKLREINEAVNTGALELAELE